MEQEKKFYVYKWYNQDTGEIFYIGKGCRGRNGQVTRRNKVFKEYYNTHNCANEIIEYFDDENDALAKEHELILYYKNIDQAIANLDDGGKGGLSFVWTQEMKDYKSKYNPMKDEKQKERMSKYNPMKDAKVAAKVGKTHRRAVIINGTYYDGVHSAAEALQVVDITICKWCSQGYDTNGNPCRYADEEQKEYSDDIKKYGAGVQQYKSVIVDNIYYPTIKAAAEANNLSYTNFATALKKNHKTYKGHTCSYANQRPSQENNQ